MVFNRFTLMVLKVDKRKYFTHFSLGSNLGNKNENLTKAIDLIEARIGEVVKRSSVYVSEPWGKGEMETFYNLVLKVATHLTPIQILSLTKQIEKDLGRNCKTKNEYENRSIDIDILFYEDFVIDLEQLNIPHPLLHLRKFVLQPLVEIDPDLIHPLLNKRVLELLLHCEDNNKIKILS